MRLVALLLLSVSPAFSSSPINAADLLKIKRVTEVQVAPDGSFAVYGVQSIYTDTAKSKDDPAYEYRTHLYFVDLTRDGAVPRQLTFGERTDGSIAISHDGQTLAFVRAAGEKKKPQVWLMPLHQPGEAHPVTELEEGANSPVWHPRGNGLLVTTSTPLSKIEGKPHFDLERPMREWFDADKPASKEAKVDARPDGDRRAIRNWLERNAARDNPTAITRLAFQAEQGLQKEMTVAQLYFIDLKQNYKAVALTRGSRSFSSCRYSADAAKLACISQPDTKHHPDRVRRSAVWLLQADGSQAKAVLDQEAESYQSVQFYPDGKALLVLAQQTDEPGFRQSRLARYDISAAKLSWIGKRWTASIQQPQVASDGTVLFSSSWHGGVPLKRIHDTQDEIEDIVSGASGVTAFDEGGGRIVYALTQVSNPNELFVLTRDRGFRQLTQLNAGWLADKQLSHPQEKWITRPDGMKVQMWVMNPIGAKEGKRYPWVLEMHGGPTAMWGPGEFTMWHEFQILCAWGYGVVYANPRGSGGYGYEFQKANFKNWGEGPADDVLAALDETVKTNPYLDKERLFLTGGSYAGYLTAWILGHDQRFKAAAAQRGVYDLTTFYGEGNAYRLVEGSFGGRPYDTATRALLAQQSPFTYAANIRTPFLIIHGSQDLRTGVSQSEMLYRALKDMGRPVEYIRYPNIGHELTRSGPPLQRMDHMLRIIEFFERYAHNDTPAPVEPQTH